MSIKRYFEKNFHRNDESVFTDKIVTIPNALTISRLVTLPLLLWALRRTDEFGMIPAIAVGSYMLLSDILDGLLARLLRQISLVGAIIDPVVDKIVINTLAIVFAFNGWLPIWAVPLIFARDFCILILGLRIFINYGILVTPVFLSRITSLCWGCLFIAGFLDIAIAKWILIPTALILTLLSGIVYLRRYEDLIHKRSEDN